MINQELAEALKAHVKLKLVSEQVVEKCRDLFGRIVDMNMTQEKIQLLFDETVISEAVISKEPTQF